MEKREITLNPRKTRKRLLFTFASGVAALAMASTAFACVTFKGEMTVDAPGGSTTVVGTGSSHAYCATGKPTTAAAGNLGDPVLATVRPGTCSGVSHQMEKGNYLVKFNNAKAYTFDGTYWNMVAGTGCFRTANNATTSDLGNFAVDVNGNGSWNGTLHTVKNQSVANAPGEAGNFCVGGDTVDPATGERTGLLAPFRYLGI